MAVMAATVPVMIACRFTSFPFLDENRGRPLFVRLRAMWLFTRFSFRLHAMTAKHRATFAQSKGIPTLGEFSENSCFLAIFERW